MLWFVALSVHNQWSVQLIYTKTKQEYLTVTQNIPLEITEILVAVYEGSFILRDQNQYMIFQVSQRPDKYRWKNRNQFGNLSNCLGHDLKNK